MATAPKNRYDLSDCAPEYAFRLIDILEDLATDLSQDEACSSGFFTYLGAAIGFVLMWATGHLWFGAAWALLLIGYDAWAQRVAHDAEIPIRERVLEGEITQRILLGPAYLVDIFDHVKGSFRLLFLGGRPDTLKGWVKLVANNLDWYLIPPGRLVRPEWICWLTVPVFMSGLGAASLATLADLPIPPRFAAGFPLQIPIVLIYTGLSGFSMWVAANSARYRRLICVRALLSDLRYHFFLRDSQ